MSEKEEKEESKGFKVQDRRRFSAEGELKPEFQGEAEPAAPPPGEAPRASARPSESQPAPGASAGRDAGEPGPEMTFASFIVGLSAQTLVHLGEVPDPVSGETRRDLTGAQQLIDLLGILQEKTRGNLDAGESSMLETILFDLRMKYVELAGRR